MFLDSQIYEEISKIRQYVFNSGGQNIELAHQEYHDWIAFKKKQLALILLSDQWLFTGEGNSK